MARDINMTNVYTKPQNNDGYNINVNLKKKNK